MKLNSYIITISIILIAIACANGQVTKIEYRNDSLYLNNIFIKNNPSKIFIDSCLKSVSTIKKSKDKHLINPKTRKSTIETTYLYKALGIYVRKFDSDSNRLTIGIKLYRDKDQKKDRENLIKDPFTGELIVAGNFINDKRTIDELQQLKNCTLNISKLQFGSETSILGGDLIYQKSVIRIAFDDDTHEMTNIYIHHNLTAR